MYVTGDGNFINPIGARLFRMFEKKKTVLSLL
jgi:hypothetical protein